MTKSSFPLVHKRILYHHRTQGQGVEGVHIRGMVDAFRELGWQVDLLGPPGVTLYAGAESAGGKETKGGRTGWWKRFLAWFSAGAPQILFEIIELFYNIHAYWTLRKMLRRRKYDFIYERYALNTFAAAILSKEFSLPLILEVNDATLIERTRPLVLKSLARYLESRVFSQASHIVAVSGYFSQLIQQAYPVKAEAILVLANALSPERVQLDPDHCLSRNDLGIRGRYVAGCAGAFVPWHGLCFLVEAVHDLLDRYDVDILFIGDGPVRGEVELLAYQYGIASRIIFTGKVPYSLVPYYLELLDVGIIPDSNQHGSPMKLFELLGMAKPVLVPAYQPILEVVTHGEEGLLFTPRDRADLRRCFEQMFAEPERQKTMGRTARQTAFANHTWAKNVERLLDFIAA